jgi:hypothetical protein
MIPARPLLLVLGLALACLLPLGASAATKCLCENGTIVHSAEDDDADEVCEEACESFGGGREWTSDDQEDEVVADVDRVRRRHPGRR